MPWCAGDYQLPAAGRLDADAANRVPAGPLPGTALRRAAPAGGHEARFGASDDVYRLPVNTCVAGFIGSYAMNFIADRASRTGATCQFSV